jgi:hypothetical protein
VFIMRVLGRPSGSIVLWVVVYAVLRLRARRVEHANQRLRLPRGDRRERDAVADVDAHGDRTKRRLYRTAQVRRRGHELTLLDAELGRVRRREWPGRCGR